MFETKREDWYFIFLASLVFFLSLSVSMWDFILIQNMNFGIINVLGLIMFLIGLTIRLIGKKTLGKHYSRGLRTLQEHKLIKEGFYKYIRHPIYSAAIIYSTGIPLFFSSLYGFIIMLGLIPLIFYRIKIEEKMMLEKFGDEYQEYMKKSKKLIPHLY